MNPDLIEQAEQLYQRLLHRSISLADSIGGCLSVPRSYYVLIARVEDVRLNAFNRLCRRQGKAHYRYYKKSDFKTDGLGLPSAQPSVALGQGGIAYFSNPANPRKIKVYQKGACS